VRISHREDGDVVQARVAWEEARIIREAEAIGYTPTPEVGSNFFRMPADFLIGPEQRLQVVFYSNAVGEHIAFGAIDGALAQAA